MGVADRAAIFDARRDRLAAAAVEADGAAAVEGAALGRDVDDAGGVQAILGRKRAVDHADIADQAAVENLAEARDAIGQKNAVDPILNVGVFVAQCSAPLAAESCENPGVCNKTLSIGVLSPCGRAAMAACPWSYELAPIRGNILLRVWSRAVVLAASCCA